MNTLILGSGSREHALAWAFSKGAGAADRVYCAPGNAGTEAVSTNVAIDPENPAAVVASARELGVGLVVVGPEVPLAAGVVDALEAAGIAAFGPGKKAAMLESSKSFARAFSERQGVPCAATARFSDAAALRRFLDENRGSRIVLKKSGLAAGKGVLESDDRAELLAFGEEVLREDELLAEEFLVGRELSVFALCDGTRYAILPACADHKKAGANDTGPNTGGMGAVCPVPYATEAAMAEIERSIVAPSFAGMASEGLSYKGVLFFGVMLTASGPRLLEYNVRFGDPETQSLLPLLETDIGELCGAVARGALRDVVPRFSDKVACGVVVAAPGYPGSYPKRLAARLPDETDLSAGKLLFQASTVRDAAGRVLTGGGRCFSSIGIGPDWASARSRAYDLASEIRFEGAWYRPDIGEKMYGGAGRR
jgi:phosphoribosylamine--glycine ligase